MNLLDMTQKRAAQALKATVLLTRPAWRHGLRHGVAATIEHRGLQERIAPATVIDVGANKGQFSLFALEAFPGCRIIAFEPLPAPATRYRQALGAYPQVRLVEAAIGPTSGTAEIHLSAREDSSSLLPIGGKMADVFPEAVSAGRTERIRVGPLLDFVSPDELRPPTLLKLDVQGFELEALKGCEAALGLVDHLYVECSYVELYAGQAMKSDIEAWLEAHGYLQVCELNLTERAGFGPVQSDCLFGRTARTDRP